MSVVQVMPYPGVVVGDGVPFSAVKLLCGFEGSHGSTSFVDESSIGRTLSNSNTPTISTTSPLVGSSSLDIDAGDAVTAAASSDFAFAGKFTIELVFRPDVRQNLRGYDLIGHGAFGSDRCWHLQWFSGPSAGNGYLRFTMSTTGGDVPSVTGSTAQDLALNTAAHIAICRDASNVVRLFKDGVMAGKNTIAGALFMPTAGLFIGDGPSGDNISGQFDEIRIIDGYDLYNDDAGFAVPSMPFPRGSSGGWPDETSTDPSYDNLGATGDRRAIVTGTPTNISIVNGTLAALVDGSNGSQIWMNDATGNGTAWMAFDWGSGLSARIDGFRWKQSNSTAQGLWNFEGSNDGSSWTALSTNLSLGGATSTDYTFTNANFYRYYRLRHMSGSRSSSPYITELEFRIVGLTTLVGRFENYGGSGDRTSVIAVTATGISAVLGTPSELVDGSQADDYSWLGATGTGAEYLLFDFGAGKSPKISGFRNYQNSTNTHGTWQLEGSNDNSSYTTLLSFTLGNAFREWGFINNTGYRYYRLRHMSGGRSGAPYLREYEFRIADLP